MSQLYIIDTNLSYSFSGLELGTTLIIGAISPQPINSQIVSKIYKTSLNSFEFQLSSIHLEKEPVIHISIVQMSD